MVEAKVELNMADPLKIGAGQAAENIPARRNLLMYVKSWPIKSINTTKKIISLIRFLPTL